MLASVSGLFASKAQITKKARRFKPAMVERINLLFGLIFFQRRVRLISMSTTKPMPPII